jgi:energy-coupling factor transport system substrate-specific component
MNKNGMMKTERLTARNLISLGIFNAIAIVLYMLVISLLGFTIVGWFFASAAAYLVLGTVYMLMAANVKKRGVFLICGVLMGVVGLTSGQIWHLVGNVVGGLLAEFVAGNYDSKKRVVVAYTTFAAGGFTGVYLPVFIRGTDYFLSRADRYGVTEEMLAEYASWLSIPVFLGLLAVCILCAIAGGWIGTKTLKKHFEKSGLIK